MDASLVLSAFVLALLLAIIPLGTVIGRYVPALRRILRALAYIYLTALVPLVIGAAVLLTYYPPFTRSPHIFVEGESKNGKFMVAGMSEGFPDWEVYLFWKPPGAEAWAVYYLTCDGDGWDNFRMTETGDHLVVRFSPQIDGSVDDLDLTTGLSKRWVDRPPAEPIYLVPRSDPLPQDSTWFDSYRKDWPTTWAAFQRRLAEK